MTKVTTAIALGILLLQAGLARAQCPTSGGNLAETRIDLNANDTTRTKTVRVEGMDAFPDCDSTVWIEYFTNGGSARGVGIGFSTLTREGDRKGRIAYADATGSRLHFRPTSMGETSTWSSVCEWSVQPAAPASYTRRQR